MTLHTLCFWFCSSSCYVVADGWYCWLQHVTFSVDSIMSDFRDTRLGSPASFRSGSSSSGLVLSPRSPGSPGSTTVDEYGMWIIGDQLFVSRYYEGAGLITYSNILRQKFNLYTSNMSEFWNVSELESLAIQ